MTEVILGISAYYHDSAAAIVVNGKIAAAAQEERFTRIKHDSSFPVNAIKYVIDAAGISPEELETIAFYDKPFIKFERLLETYHAFAPRGLISFTAAIPVWIKDKLFLKKNIRDELSKIINKKAPLKILFPEHHLSHAASAFYPSPYKNAAIMTIDGVGEWATTTLGFGEENQITVLQELQFPHSIGLLYAAFTYYLGFRVNSGEYKLMGLAPYGDPDSEQTRKFIDIIKKQLVDIREDGSVLLNMRNFKFATGLRMVSDKKWSRIFGINRRKPEDSISTGHTNLALAVQLVLEEIVLKLAKTVKNLTNSENLVMAGGVALNSVANGKLLSSGLFKNIWIQPASTDAGGAIGAALASWHIYSGKSRIIYENSDSMQGSFLGPGYDEPEIIRSIKALGARYIKYDLFDSLCKDISLELASGKVVGWFQGRMEFGPRALGNRSILADARNPEIQKKLNLKIKMREGFRPFAPSVLEEDAAEFFITVASSPYMLFVLPVQQKILEKIPENYKSSGLFEKLYVKRSVIPAVTHVDFSARPQTVNSKTNPKFHQLIRAFKKLTGTGLLVNTSFNVRGEPIVCTPDDAYRCFMNTGMDLLVMDCLVFRKEDQPELTISTKFDPD